MRRIFLLFSFLLLFSCSKKSEVVTKWPYGVDYEIFVRSFADSNGDGIGDFNGLTAKLDYVAELGIGGIWLMPIMPAPSYHKYDVVDYKSVDSEYGTEEDFKKLIDEAHKRGIHIIIDLVINHTSSEHPWFKEAMKGKDNLYRDYYVWANKDSIRLQISKKTISLDSDNITQWHAVNGDTLGEHYYGFFYGGMPDLNMDNLKVREEIVEIGKYWLSEMNVDGFRLDAAKHIFPTERADDNHAFWVWFRSEMQKIKPDVYLVGEVWSKAEDVAPYLKGLPALFNFDMGYAITSSVKAGKDTLNLIGTYKSIYDFYLNTTSDFIDATFLKNHDQNRILSELDGNVDKEKVASGILMTLPGTPYVYYGEEIGMLGTKPDEYIREPFLWDYDKKEKLQASWEEPRYSNDKSVIPLSKQKEDPSSLYNHYKKIIEYRNKSNVLTYGVINSIPLNIQEVVGFIRSKDGDERLVLHNISDTELTIDVPESLKKFTTIEFESKEGSTVNNSTITLPPYVSVVLK